MTKKQLLLGSVKVAAELADRIRPPEPGITVLIYHRVGGRSRSEIDIQADQFDRQMELLAAQGRVITLDEGLKLMTVPGEPSSDAVIVTFDDGTADFIEDALPILERYRVPATLYVATDFVERGRPFPGEAPALSWQALADAMSTGLVTVGSHTHTHVLLDRVPPEVAEEEIAASVGLIEDRLGVEAAHFAYPKAVVGSAETEAVVRRRFRSAAVGGGRANPRGRTDPYRISRSAIQATDGMRWFRRKADGGMALEETFRERLNRRRYETLSN